MSLEAIEAKVKELREDIEAEVAAIDEQVKELTVRKLSLIEVLEAFEVNNAKPHRTDFIGWGITDIARHLLQTQKKIHIRQVRNFAELNGIAIKSRNVYATLQTSKQFKRVAPATFALAGGR